VKYGAPEVTSVVFRNMLLVLGQTRATPTGKIEAIRNVAHLLNLRCTQLREMLGILESSELRADMVVTLFLRVTDIWNEKLFRVRFEDAKDVFILQRRLGACTFFPYIQPEQILFEYDFAFHDQRIAGHMMCVVDAREGGNGITKYSLTREDGTLDPLPQGVPKLWETLARMPTSGVFRGHYNCSPDDRCVKFRAELLAKYANWTFEVEIKNVMWWASLSEAPEDVVTYLEFMIPRFPCINTAYGAVRNCAGIGCGGMGANGFNLHTFEESISSMGCRRFEGAHQHDRIKGIFRYLDSSAEGEISKPEWKLLEELWQEIKLSVDEFKKFLHRTFHGNLRLAWDFFHEGSGEITIEEWCTAVLRVGYYGPVAQTFHFIDLDFGGTISWEEFEAMWTKHEKIKGVVEEDNDP